MAREESRDGLTIRALKVFVVAALVVAGLEIVLRLLEPRLDRPQEWYQDAAQQAIDEMDRVREAGLQTDVVFVGSSMVRRGVQIPIVEDELDSVDFAGNLGLPYANTSVVRRWLLEQVMPRLQPRRVVWGVQSSSFNGSADLPPLEVYERTRATRPGILGPLDRVLARYLFLSRHRAQLRDPEALSHVFSPPAAESLAELDDLLSPTNVRRRPRPGADTEAPEELASQFSIGERETRDFRYTVGRLQEAGIDLVLVVMPIPTAYVAGHPNGEADIAAFRTWVAAEAEALGVPLFDFSRALPDDLFADRAHLLAQGADALSVMLSASLRSLGW
jgi:hypothetical protein